MKYKLIRGGVNNLQKMENEINEYIQQGWLPVGEIKMVTSDGQTVFVQQMENRNYFPVTSRS